VREAASTATSTNASARGLEVGQWRAGEVQRGFLRGFEENPTPGENNPGTNLMERDNRAYGRQC